MHLNYPEGEFAVTILGRLAFAIKVLFSPMTAKE